MTIAERTLEKELITKLQELKYSYRNDIRNRAGLEANFREKFQRLTSVKLTDEEFARLLE
jgi:type I restriction enzyme R subunit